MTKQVQSIQTKPDFKFWVPGQFEFEKGKSDPKTGVKSKDKWKFKGIASTADVDTDGEILLPQGFDLSYFLSDGFVNWNHQSKNNPSAIIGEPTFAEIRPEGMYVETELYQDSVVAKSVWELGEILEKAKSNRRLGFSIEGKILEKDPNDEKKITRAKITGLAITPSPKNKATFADIMKGLGSGTEVFEGDWEFDLVKGIDSEEEYIVDMIDEEGNRVTIDKALNINIVKAEETNKDDDEEDEDEEKKKEKEKSLTTTSGAAVVPSNFSTANKKKDEKESLKNLQYNLETSQDSSNLKKKLTKSEVYENIFINVTTDLEKAEKIFTLIEKIELKKSNTMKIKEISMDSINEAYGALGINLEKGEAATITKAETTPTDTSVAGESANGYSVDMVMGMYKGMDTMKKKSEYVSKAIEKGVSSDTAEKAYTKAVEKGILKGEEEEDDEEAEKALKAAEDDMKKAEDDAKEKKEKFEAMKNKGKKEVKKSSKDEGKTDKVEKSENPEIVKAILETGSLVKALAEQNQELIKALGDQKSEFSKALEDQNKKIEELGRIPNQRRSVQTTNYIEKGNVEAEIEKAQKDGKTVLNLASPSDSKTFLNMLERKTFEKGVVDEFYGNVMAQMELGSHIALQTLKKPGVIEKIQSDLNVKLVG